MLGNKYLGLIVVYLVYRSGLGEKVAGFIGDDQLAGMTIRNSTILAYLAAQYYALGHSKHRP